VIFGGLLLVKFNTAKVVESIGLWVNFHAGRVIGMEGAF